MMVPLLLAASAAPAAAPVTAARGRLSVAPGPVPQGQGLEVFGYCWQQQHRLGEPCHYPMVNSSGVGWVRNQLHWSHVETRRGEYNFSLPNVTADTGVGPEDYDAFVLGMKADGIKVLMILGGCGPDCSNPLYPSVATPPGREAESLAPPSSATTLCRVTPTSAAQGRLSRSLRWPRRCTSRRCIQAAWRWSSGTSRSRAAGRRPLGSSRATTVRCRLLTPWRWR